MPYEAQGTNALPLRFIITLSAALRIWQRAGSLLHADGLGLQGGASNGAPLQVTPRAYGHDQNNGRQ